MPGMIGIRGKGLAYGLTIGPAKTSSMFAEYLREPFGSTLYRNVCRKTLPVTANPNDKQTESSTFSMNGQVLDKPLPSVL